MSVELSYPVVFFLVATSPGFLFCMGASGSQTQSGKSYPSISQQGRGKGVGLVKTYFQGKVKLKDNNTECWIEKIICIP